MDIKKKVKGTEKNEIDYERGTHSIPRPQSPMVAMVSLPVAPVEISPLGPFLWVEWHDQKCAKPSGYQVTVQVSYFWQELYATFSLTGSVWGFWLVSQWEQMPGVIGHPEHHLEGQRLTGPSTIQGFSQVSKFPSWNWGPLPWSSQSLDPVLPPPHLHFINLFSNIMKICNQCLCSLTPPLTLFQTRL